MKRFFILLIVLLAGCTQNLNDATDTNSEISNDSIISEYPDELYSNNTIASHNSEGDCWVIFEGNVYDLTDYLNAHPGGAQVIIDVCGADATNAFNSLPHSTAAENNLENYYIGDLEDV